MRKHRRFLLVKAEDGEELYFRSYDPRVLRVFVPTCTPEEARTFFGPIRAFLVEANEPETLLTFTVSQTGAQQVAVSFSAPVTRETVLSNPS